MPNLGEGSHCYNWEIAKISVNLWNPEGIEPQVPVSCWDWAIGIKTKGESGGSKSIAFRLYLRHADGRIISVLPEQLLLWPPYYFHCYAQWLFKSYFGCNSWALSNIYIFIPHWYIATWMASESYVKQARWQLLGVWDTLCCKGVEKQRNNKKSKTKCK